MSFPAGAWTGVLDISKCSRVTGGTPLLVNCVTFFPLIEHGRAVAGGVHAVERGRNQKQQGDEDQENN